MAKKMEIILPDDNVRAVTTLLEDEAPKTCKVIWDALPIEGKLWHGMFSGNETFIVLEGESVIKVEPENVIWHVIPGDVCYYYSWREGKGTWKDVREFSEIVIIYGRYADVKDRSMRTVPVNLFGSITENLEGYAKAVAKIREVGLKRVIFKKYAQ